MSGAWSFRVELVVVIRSGIKLFDCLGMSRCHNTLFQSSPYF